MTDTGTDQIAWRALRYGTPVFTADGQQAGTMREVLGSDGEDIFHGLRVLLDHTKREVMVPASDVTTLTDARIDTDLSPAAMTGLADFHESATYHLASVGWLRKHLGWTADSKSDEESN